MPLHGNPDIARLLEWMTEPSCHSLNDQEPSNWTPFQGCGYCDGLCSVLESADSVRRLLDRQRIQIFQGRYEDLANFAMRGCDFAEYLRLYLKYYWKTDYGLDEPIDLAFRRVDETGPSSVRIVALVQGDKGEDAKPYYLAVATAPSKFTLACPIRH